MSSHHSSDPATSASHMEAPIGRLPSTGVLKVTPAPYPAGILSLKLFYFFPKSFRNGRSRIWIGQDSRHLVGPRYVLEDEKVLLDPQPQFQETYKRASRAYRICRLSEL